MGQYEMGENEKEKKSIITIVGKRILRFKISFI